MHRISDLKIHNVLTVSYTSLLLFYIGDICISYRTAKLDRMLCFFFPIKNRNDDLVMFNRHPSSQRKHSCFTVSSQFVQE